MKLTIPFFTFKQHFLLDFPPQRLDLYIPEHFLLVSWHLPPRFIHFRSESKPVMLPVIKPG